jgi:hypothetical protein
VNGIVNGVANGVVNGARTAVVLGESMDGNTLNALGDACARLRAGMQVWNPGAPLAADTRPAVVVGALAAGTRRIPDEIIELADRRFPGTQVLLVCDEPLIRPTLTLQHGRLTLIEPPATVERMTSRIRMLLADEPDEQRSHPRVVRLEPGAPGSVASQEFRRGPWWAAQLACHAGDADASAARTCLALDHGLTVVLTPPWTSVDDETIERALELLARDPDAEDLGDQLEDALGPEVGLVHFTDERQSWLVYWPCHGRPLWLFSTERLPRWSDLARGGDSTLLRLPAVAGDVIAALSSGTVFAESGPVASLLPSTEVSAAMLDGGPALLGLFESRLAVSPRSFSCVFAEVR